MKAKYIHSEIYYEVEAFKLIKRLGKEGAAKFCEDIINEGYGKINSLEYYDSDIITALQNKIYDFGAIKLKINQGYESQ